MCLQFNNNENSGQQKSRSLKFVCFSDHPYAKQEQCGSRERIGQHSKDTFDENRETIGKNQSSQNSK